MTPSISGSNCMFNMCRVELAFWQKQTLGCLVCESSPVVTLPFLRESLILHFSFIIFFGLVGRLWSFGAWFLPRFPLFFPPFSRLFCRVFFWPPSLADTYPKLRSFSLLYSVKYFHNFVFQAHFGLQIKRSGLLRYNKPDMLLVVICVLLGGCC